MIAEPLSLAHAQQALKPRAVDAHKGNFGHVLVIAGDDGMGGAARMAGEAALRVGAGLVTLATHPSHAAIISAMRPELIAFGIANADTLIPLLARASVLVLGPGLTDSPWSTALLQKAAKSPLPKVIDAGALRFLQHQPINLDHAILTPHPGEAAALLNTTPQLVQQDREHSIQQLAARYPATWVLKGAGTLLRTTTGQLFRCIHGNPGMATAGMGDVLTGMIAGFLAQGLSPTDAAALGVTLHAATADRLAAERTDGFRFLASDLWA